MLEKKKDINKKKMLKNHIKLTFLIKFGSMFLEYSHIPYSQNLQVNMTLAAGTTITEPVPFPINSMNIHFA